MNNPEEKRILFVTKYVAGCLPNLFSYHGEWTDTYELILALKKNAPALEIFVLTPKIRDEHKDRFENEFGKFLAREGIKHFTADVYLDYGMSPEKFRWQLFLREIGIVWKYRINIIQYGQFGINYTRYFKKIMGVKKIICYGCFDDKNEWIGKSEDDRNKKKLSTYSFDIKEKIHYILLKMVFKSFGLKLFSRKVDNYVLMHPLGYKLFKEKYPRLSVSYIPKGQTRPSGVEKVKIGDRITNILFIGALQYRKGIIELLEIAGCFPELKFTIIGNGDMDIVRKIIEYSKLYNNIIYLESASYAEKWQYYIENDVFILPSHKDTFPSVILEALSCSLPVITTYEIDSPVVDKKNGLLFHSGNIMELKDKLSYMINNPTKYKEMSDNALDSSRIYSWEEAARRFINIY